MATNTTKALTVKFTQEKETKGTIRYTEITPADTDEAVVGTLYVRKAAAAKLGNPADLTVTIAAQ